MNKQIVIIGEERVITDQINILSEELDYSSKTVTQKIISTLQDNNYQIKLYSSPKQFIDNIKQHKNDIVFATLWGGSHSRNKRSYLPSICEAYHIKYIGGDTNVQSLCQDKYLTKLFLKNYKFAIPKAIEIYNNKELNNIELIDFLPCIIKPNDEGSSVGISDSSIAYSMEQVRILTNRIISTYSPVLIEEFINGREISICLVGSNGNIDICEAVELLLDNCSIKNKIWGYESKKNGKCEVTRKIVTNEIPKYIMEEAKKLFLSLGKVDLMRIDGRLKNNNFFIIELSPDCSLHENCFMSTAFKHNNYTYFEMLKKLIDNINKDIS